jgi:hypothetical protein
MFNVTNKDGFTGAAVATVHITPATNWSHLAITLRYDTVAFRFFIIANLIVTVTIL